MATANQNSQSEMDTSANNQEVVDFVKRRTRELYRVKTGRASETVSSSKSAIRQENSDRSDRTSGQDDRRSSGSGNDAITLQALWDKISKMDEVNRRNMEGHSEMIANLAANVLTIQDSMNSNTPKGKTLIPPLTTEGDIDNERNAHDISDVGSDNNDGLEDISDDDDLNIDNVDEDTVEQESQSFFEELEALYQEKKKLGENTGEKMAKVVNKAIDNTLDPKILEKLENDYLVPENCSRMQVPKVNKELWKGFQTKRQRESDLAIQSVQKSLTTSLVMVIRSLDIINSTGDMTKVKSMTKDMFKVLAHGICTANKKRKQLIAQNVPFKYRKVVQVDTPVTEYLFGDNLESKVDELEKEDKRANKLSIGGNSFLEKGKGFKRPPPQHGNKNIPHSNPKNQKMSTTHTKKNDKKHDKKSNKNHINRN